MSQDEKIIQLYPEEHEPQMTELAPGTLDNSFNQESEDETSREEPSREDLPTALQRRQFGCYIFSGLLAIFSIILAIYFKELRLLIGILIALYIAYMGFSIKRDFLRGDIIEALLICSSVAANPLSKNAKVIFRTDDDVPDYYSFIVPKKWTENFTPNVMYLVYFNTHTPNNLLGYEQL